MIAGHHLMKLSLLACLALSLTLTFAAPAGGKGQGALPRTSPEAAGIPSDAILDFITEAERSIDSLHSFMLVRHGKVVAEGWWTPYDAQTAHELYSLSKSFTSTAVGLAVSEGKMTLDDPVAAAFPEDGPVEQSQNLKSMRVRDLLCMSTGHEKEPPTSRDLVCAKSFLAQPVPCKPGTRFLYNTAATFMLSAMVQKATGQTVVDYLQPRLFDPLGMGQPVWQTNFQGVSLGGYGLSVRTEDIAKFGQLYLQRGRWNGKPLLQPEWADLATSRQTSNGSNPKSDWDQGYGFQFWRCRHGAYRGDGAFGQYCIVMPEQDAVIAITSGVKDMQAAMNLIWDRLLPAMRKGGLPRDRTAERSLREKLAHLTLPLPAGKPTSPLASRISGKTYAFPSNDQQVESVTLHSGPGAESVVLAVRIDGAERRIQTQFGRWEKTRLPYGNQGEKPVAVSGAWQGDDTYVFKICYFETPFTTTVKLRFATDELVYDAEANVGFGATKRPTLVGKSK